MKKRRVASILSVLFFTGQLAASPEDVVAQSELQLIGQALVQLQADTTFFTTIENLNDLGSSSVSNAYDYINDSGGALVIRPFFGDFDSSRVNLLARPVGLEWQGPYLNVQQSRTSTSNFYDVGTFLDPWGRPYLFFSPLGLLNPTTESVTLDFYGDDFNQYTLVSLGFDGIVSGDDHTYGLGIGVTRLVISSSSLLSGAPTGGLIGTTANQEEMGSATAPYTLRIKGYLFGAAPGTVELNGVSTPVASWSANEITVGLETVPNESVVVTVTTQGSQATSRTGFVNRTLGSGISNWELYQ